MSRRSRLESELGALLERLVLAADSRERDRALLESALHAARGRGAALWLRTESGWAPLLSLGDADALPEPERVRALLEAQSKSAFLRADERVVQAPDGVRALVLGGIRGAEVEDLLEALLVVHGTLSPGSGGAHPPLPAPDPRTE